MQRRLAAVLIADVVGYVRLSQADEEGTRARFQTDLHEVFEPAIAVHHGRLVKTMGDALLVEFHSVVDAERCAVEIQRSKVERNAGVPVDKRLVYRIGINLGDVIIEGDDIHGDGVNIADRLQELADPAGITISGTAYDQVKTKVEVGYGYLGQQRVKHVAEPVRVYRVLLDPNASGKTIGAAKKTWQDWRWPAPATALVAVVAAGVAAWQRPWEPEIEVAAVERMALPLPDKPSIIVLPFANMGGNADEDYFADGITEDLTTDLSRLSGLFVISRNTAFTYKDKTVKPAQVAEELGIRYILEGSVRRGGSEARINAQLIDALNGGHVWAERYDGPINDVFALQDKVTNAIVDALALRLTNEEQIAVRQKETISPKAYDAFLRGWVHMRRSTGNDLVKALPYLEEAIRVDPDYGRAQAALALLYVKTSNNSEYPRMLGISEFEASSRADQYLEQAEKHPTALSHQVAALKLWIANDVDAALAELKEAIALDSGDSLSYAYMGGTLTTAGRPAEAIPHIRTAMRLDPHYPHEFMLWLGLAQFALEDFEGAASSFASATKLNPDDEWPFMALAASFGQLGRTEDAAAALARHNQIRIEHGGVPLTMSNAPRLRFRRTADVQRLWKGLRLAGVPE
jgi:TolB-like protein/class 3 adenylate cyclase/Tfp pilus assembly protein PilF